MSNELSITSGTSPIQLEINEVLESNNVVNRHSFFQLKYFVIGKEPTIQSKLRRCLLELEARKESLASYQGAIEESLDDICLADLEIRKIEQNTGPEPIDKEIAGLHVRKLKRKKMCLEMAIQSMEKKLKECEEESNFILSEYKALLELEGPKSYDELESNVEYWNAKFLEEMNLRMMLGRPLDIEIVKSILQLPDEVPVKKEMNGILDQIKQKALSSPKVKVHLEDQTKENNG
jgi:chaperonin cofactor prefoldin